MVEQTANAEIIIPPLGKAQRGDNPLEIANQLVAEHGLAEALSIVGLCKINASQTDDNYALSIWREVFVILRDQSDGVDGSENSAEIADHLSDPL
jgi:hypothetical protein